MTTTATNGPATQVSPESCERIGVLDVDKLDRLLGLLELTCGELRVLELDASARARLTLSHRDVLVELASDLDDEMIDEMLALELGPIAPGSSDAEIRAAYCQLLGWLHGLRLPLTVERDATA